jgi:hypothetical protein
MHALGVSLSVALVLSSGLLGCSRASNRSAPDRDCPSFGSQGEAQAFYESEGGPDKDGHRLDADDDGVACESL